MPNKGRIAWVLAALTLAIAAAGLMTVHTVRHILRVRRGHEIVRPWMSVPYIAHSRHAPAADLYHAIGLPPDHRDRRPIGRIARQQGRPVGELIARLEAAIARAHGRPPPRESGAVP